MSHKITSAVIVAVVLIGGYGLYQKLHGTNTAVRYVLARVEKGTIVSYVTSSGQVSVSTQLDLKPKVSADVVYVGVKDGEVVKAGTLITQLDSTDAAKAVRDAQANLDSANLGLQKLQKPADDLSILQAQHAFDQARELKKNAENDLPKAYDSGFNTVANAFLDVSPAMSGIMGILFGTELSGTTGTQSNLAYYADVVKNYDAKSLDYKNQASDAYSKARRDYDVNFQNYKSLTRFSDTKTIDTLISETYETTRDVAEAIKGSNNLIQFYEDKLIEHNVKQHPLADTHLASLNTYAGKINTHLLNLLSIKNTIDEDKQAITNAERTIAEKTASLAKLKIGADSIDIQTQQLTIRQRENALLDAKEKLANYFIRAPFDGIVAKLNVKKGDSATIATIIATLITKQQLAEISMNEVDVANVKVGDRATITFDAVSNLSITGAVAEIDAIGTMAQGVVSYGVKIGFDTQDNRVKPGMSISASIITDTKIDNLYLQNSAVKSQNGASYVEVPDSADIPRTGTIATSGVVLSKPTSRKSIEIGISNDDVTEIISGLKENDIVVGRTINISAGTQTQQNSSSLRIPGLPGGGGGGGAGRGGGGFRGN